MRFGAPAMRSSRDKRFAASTATEPRSSMDQQRTVVRVMRWSHVARRVSCNVHDQVTALVEAQITLGSCNVD